MKTKALRSSQIGLNSLWGVLQIALVGIKNDRTWCSVLPIVFLLKRQDEVIYCRLELVLYYSIVQVNTS